MGIPYTAIIQGSTHRKRVRYEDDPLDEALQPARRLQRRNAMRELRHGQGEAVPLLMRSLHIGNNTRSIREGDEHIRQLESRLSSIRSNIASSIGYRAASDPRQVGNVSGNGDGSQSTWGQASTQTAFDQYIQPPQLNRPQGVQYDPRRPPFQFPRAVDPRLVRGPLSDRARRAMAHSSIDSRGLGFDRVLANQGRSQSRGVSPRSFDGGVSVLSLLRARSRAGAGAGVGGGAGDNPNRHAMVIGNGTDTDTSANDHNNTNDDNELNDNNDANDNHNEPIQEDEQQQEEEQEEAAEEEDSVEPSWTVIRISTRPSVNWNYRAHNGRQDGEEEEQQQQQQQQGEEEDNTSFMQRFSTQREYRTLQEGLREGEGVVVPQQDLEGMGSVQSTDVFRDW